MYVARSVCLGRLQTYILCLMGVPMPTLTGEAKDLYVKAYGQDRYDRFTDKDTFHGGKPPARQPKTLPAFVHRPAHDAESIYWTMVAALLRVHPKSAEREQFASEMVAMTWDTLHRHKIPDQPLLYRDPRNEIVTMGDNDWQTHFFPEMNDVATLLHDISRQLAPEYEFWSPRPPDDHLHEAMQRLILQYLVEHRDQPIPLDTDYQRPTEAQTPEDKGKTRGTSVSRHTRDEAPAASSSSTRKASKKEPQTSSYKAPVQVAGSSTSSRCTVDRSSMLFASSMLIVADPKRKSVNQGGRRRKRLKTKQGSLTIDEEDED